MLSKAPTNRHTWRRFGRNAWLATCSSLRSARAAGRWQGRAQKRAPARCVRRWASWCTARARCLRWRRCWQSSGTWWRTEQSEARARGSCQCVCARARGRVGRPPRGRRRTRRARVFASPRGGFTWVSWRAAGARAQPGAAVAHVPARSLVEPAPRGPPLPRRYLEPNPPAILALGLSSRKNLCIHPVVAGGRATAAPQALPHACQKLNVRTRLPLHAGVTSARTAILAKGRELRVMSRGLRVNTAPRRRSAEEGSRESVDAGCRRLTAAWTRERAARDPSVELCDFFEQHEAAGQDALLPPGGRARARAHVLCQLISGGAAPVWGFGTFERLRLAGHAAQPRCAAPPSRARTADPAPPPAAPAAAQACTRCMTFARLGARRGGAPTSWRAT